MTRRIKPVKLQRGRRGWFPWLGTTVAVGAVGLVAYNEYGAQTPSVPRFETAPAPTAPVVTAPPAPAADAQRGALGARSQFALASRETPLLARHSDTVLTLLPPAACVAFSSVPLPGSGMAVVTTATAEGKYHTGRVNLADLQYDATIKSETDCHKPRLVAPAVPPASTALAPQLYALREDTPLKSTPTAGFGTMFAEIGRETCVRLYADSPQTGDHAKIVARDTDGRQVAGYVVKHALTPAPARVTPEACTAFWTERGRPSQQLTGYGLNVSKYGRALWVTGVIENSPAWRNDIRAGDRIRSINTVPVAAMTTDGAKSMLDAAVNSVQLTVRHQYTMQDRTIDLPREQIHAGATFSTSTSRPDNSPSNAIRRAQGSLSGKFFTVTIDALNLRDNVDPASSRRIGQLALGTCVGGMEPSLRTNGLMKVSATNAGGYALYGFVDPVELTAAPAGTTPQSCIARMAAPAP